ncbi:hypothetical protein [Piscirickettsia salmonis]|uniref:hypothetical protein n=1 Tax=Piscirickettsia salmonis TaxID=1238 RepID=UPI0007C97CFA|nr:hypothetical protein A0O36_00831 [Piscirickettsiaceae bacterium NZ-RLO1]
MKKITYSSLSTSIILSLGLGLSLFNANAYAFVFNHMETKIERSAAYKIHRQCYLFAQDRAKASHQTNDTTEKNPKKTSYHQIHQSTYDQCISSAVKLLNKDLKNFESKIP